jgi:hypothetical protein
MSFTVSRRRVPELWERRPTALDAATRKRDRAIVDRRIFASSDQRDRPASIKTGRAEPLRQGVRTRVDARLTDAKRFSPHDKDEPVSSVAL